MEQLAQVAPEVRDRLVVRFGPAVVAWCDRLPALLDDLAARWGLDVVAAGGGGTSRVFRCVRRTDGAMVWMKLSPDRRVAEEEAEALRAWAGTPSVVGLLGEDRAAGALLLENVAPGVPAARLDWRLPQAASLLRDLRGVRPVPGTDTVLRPLAHRIGFLFDLVGRRLAAAGLDRSPDAEVLAGARAAALDLAATGPVGLVHGDLHTANVLSGRAAPMVAIDPRPAWGDPDFDAADWALGGAVDRAGLDQRIETLADLVPGLSADRLAGWCRAVAALTAASRRCVRRDDPETRLLAGLARG